jgi:hypothetical protein
MKRVLMLLLAASMASATVTAETLSHTEAPPHTQAAGQCASDCDPGMNSPADFESSSHLRGSMPAARATMLLMILVCVSLIMASLVIMASRVRTQSRSRAAREAQMLQEWAVQAAVLRKPMDGGAQTMTHWRPVKEATGKRSPVPRDAQITPQTADSYWTYQARQRERHVA